MTRLLALLAQGKDVKPAAEELGLTVREGRHLLADALAQLGAVNATHAVAKAIGHGLIPAGVAL